MAIDKRQVRRSFGQAAAHYDRVAVLQHDIGQRLLERLDYVRLQPERILDLGCGTGRHTAALLRRYPQAEVIGLDFAWPMVQQTCRQRVHWRRRVRGMCADLEQLPLAAHSVDLIFSNAALQWCRDPRVAFAEMQRILRPDGLVLFTSFGPDTLFELRQAWLQCDTQPRVHTFRDMHDYGDQLLQSRLLDPVMDCERITMTYPQVSDILRELKLLGATYAAHERRRGLTGRAQLNALAAAYEVYRRADGSLPVTYEVIYGHAWAGEMASAQPSAVQVPLDTLTRRQKATS
ncbi:MAG: malonyl-ACP O-methyltransferase BioC [Pseudomonadota bacterium]